jgi:hypothetical protein
MQKVLLISYLWPPQEGVGLVRALKFAKYLPLYGWEAVVLTASPADGDSLSLDSPHQAVKVYRTPYRDVLGGIKTSLGGRSMPSYGRPSVIRRFAREMIAMPDEQIGWRKGAVEAGLKAINDYPVDLIFSTSPPETAHLVARSLKRQSGLPWIADLRDLWAFDHFRKRHPAKKAALRLMERFVLKDAERIVTVSRPWAERLGASTAAKEKIRVIENGFDEEDFSGWEYEGGERLIFAYTGKLHKEYQRIDTFLRALRELIDEGRVNPKMIEVRFYVLGYDKPDIKSLAASYGLSGVVNEFAKVGYKESLRIQRMSDVLLLVQWQGASSDGWYSAKLYDYLGARRPILAMAKKGGIVDELITSANSGFVADTVSALKDAVLSFYKEHKETGRVSYRGDDTRVSGYSRRFRAKELAHLFDEVAGYTIA